MAEAETNDLKRQRGLLGSFATAATLVIFGGTVVILCRRDNVLLARLPSLLQRGGEVTDGEALLVAISNTCGGQEWTEKVSINSKEYSESDAFPDPLSLSVVQTSEDPNATACTALWTWDQERHQILLAIEGMDESELFEDESDDENGHTRRSLMIPREGCMVGPPDGDGGRRNGNCGSMTFTRGLLSGGDCGTGEGGGRRSCHGSGGRRRKLSASGDLFDCGIGDGDGDRRRSGDCDQHARRLRDGWELLVQWN